MNIANIVLLILTGLSALAVLFFVIRGLRARSMASENPYGVGKQEIRHDRQVNFLRAGFMLIITLILLGIYGLIPGEGAAEATATPASAPTQVITTAAPENTATPEDAAVTATPAPTATPMATEVTATTTPTATLTPEATDPRPANTAVVNSPNGLWLREAPGGSQEVELIAHETDLLLLAGRETVDDLEWQQVRTPAGNEGWVAAEFLIFP